MSVMDFMPVPTILALSVTCSRSPRALRMKMARLFTWKPVKTLWKPARKFTFKETSIDIHDLLNGIVPEATTPSWPEGCFLDGKDYDWMTNIARMEGIESAVACQKLCQQTVGCEKFTYHYNTETSKNCWLKNGGGLSTLSDVKGTISGPQFCP